MKSAQSRTKVGNVAVHGAIPETNPSQRADTDDRLADIATKAYYKAEARGFQSGCEIDDWLAAEAELNGRQEH